MNKSLSDELAPVDRQWLVSGAARLAIHSFIEPKYIGWVR
jgi:hypothetical protein